MSEHLTIKFEIAELDSRIARDASEILHPFALLGSSQLRTGPNRDFAEKYFFSKEGEPGILAVAYLGEIATSAQTLSEHAMTPGKFDRKKEVPYYYLPYLGIFLAATDPDYRNLGHGSQMVSATADLARVVGFERLQAIWVANPKAREFWGKNGFVDVPFPTFGDMELKIKDVCQTSSHTGVSVITDHKVIKRLREFKTVTLNSIPNLGL